MYFYEFNNKYLFSYYKYDEFNEINEQTIANADGIIYYLCKLDPSVSRKSFCTSAPSLLNIKNEGIDLLKAAIDSKAAIPSWLLKKIDNKEVMSVNTLYPNFKSLFTNIFPTKWRINIVGLGDVGGILTTGLKILGANKISQIGIYDLSVDKAKRWEYEINQINSADNQYSMPMVKILNEDEIFNCDMFVFCVSVGVPPVGDEKKDVRLIQYEGNSKIIAIYAKKAREASFKGIFSVVSDPVDLLCKAAYLSSNTNEDKVFDYNGLTPEQIKGFGLGVMNARALYYSRQREETLHYSKEGRAFGPHGEGLIIADSLENYNDELSLYLTEKAKKANLDVRETGFKPYIAPAISSGALSILDAISGKWHYSSNYIGGVYMGVKNRLLETGVEIEQIEMPEKLFRRIEDTYNMLKEM